MNKNDLGKIKLKYDSGVNLSNCSFRVYSNNETGITITIYTPKRSGKYGHGETIFSIKNEILESKSLEDFVEHINKNHSDIADKICKLNKEEK